MHKRNSSSKSPRPQVKQSISQASTTAKKSPSKKASMSPFMRNNCRPNSSRGRLTPQRQNSPLPLSETVKERFNAINKTRQVSKEVGKEALVNSVQRKELSQQVQALANRIKKLKQEEEAMAKKIHETATKTEKVCEIKQRRAHDLFNRVKQKERESNEIYNKRLELARKKTIQRHNLQQSAEENLRAKRDIANDTRLDNQHNKLIKEQIERFQNEKNKMLIDSIKYTEKSIIESKVSKETTLKTDLNQSYYGKINTDKEEVENLGNKLKELTSIEDQLINRLNESHSLHKMKHDELERLFNLRVSAPNILEDLNLKEADRIKSTR